MPLVFDYSMNNSTLEHVKSYSYLEATLADILLLSDHVHKVVLKANHTLGLLRSNFWGWKFNIMIIAYDSLVCPQLVYACSIWDLYHQGEIHNIKMVQRHAAWFVCRNYRRKVGVVSSLFFKLNWSTLQECQNAARLTLL